MTTENGAQYMVYRPTPMQRFWRAIGFRSVAPPDLSSEVEAWPGWMMTEVHIKASIADRVRFLLCGRALVRVRTHSTQDAGDTASTSSFELIPPFAKHHRVPK